MEASITRDPSDDSIPEESDKPAAGSCAWAQKFCCKLSTPTLPTHAAIVKAGSTGVATVARGLQRKQYDAMTVSKEISEKVGKGIVDVTEESFAGKPKVSMIDTSSSSDSD